jgi:peptidoglycan/xylan/chitin deacetylase (PgdA/CDA1 family)
MTFALIYHDLAARPDRDGVGFPGPLAGRYKLDPARFGQHLDAIARAGAAVGLLGRAGARPAVAITFDDGGASAPLAAELLERRGWRGHFFVTTGRIGTPGFMDRDAVRELARRGHLVGSHSVTHPTYMGRLDRGSLDREWRESAAALADALGERPWAASVPGGFLTPAVVASAAEAGYELLLTSEPSARERRHAGMAVLGRYTIWESTSAAQAAGYARGAAPARARLWLEWNAKGVPKRLSPSLYQALRRVRAGR